MPAPFTPPRRHGRLPGTSRLSGLCALGLATALATPASASAPAADPLGALSPAEMHAARQASRTALFELTAAGYRAALPSIAQQPLTGALQCLALAQLGAAAALPLVRDAAAAAPEGPARSACAQAAERLAAGQPLDELEHAAALQRLLDEAAARPELAEAVARHRAAQPRALLVALGNFENLLKQYGSTPAEPLLARAHEGARRTAARGLADLCVAMSNVGTAAEAPRLRELQEQLRPHSADAATACGDAAQALADGRPRTAPEAMAERLKWRRVSLLAELAESLASLPTTPHRFEPNAVSSSCLSLATVDHPEVRGRLRAAAAAIPSSLPTVGRACAYAAARLEAGLLMDTYEAGMLGARIVPPLMTEAIAWKTRHPEPSSPAVAAVRVQPTVPADRVPVAAAPTPVAPPPAPAAAPPPAAPSTGGGWLSALAGYAAERTVGRLVPSELRQGAEKVLGQGVVERTAGALVRDAMSEPGTPSATVQTLQMAALGRVADKVGPEVVQAAVALAGGGQSLAPQATIATAPVAPSAVPVAPAAAMALAAAPRPAPAAPPPECAQPRQARHSFTPADVESLDFRGTGSSSYGVRAEVAIARLPWLAGLYTEGEAGDGRRIELRPDGLGEFEFGSAAPAGRAPAPVSWHVVTDRCGVPTVVGPEQDAIYVMLVEQVPGALHNPRGWIGGLLARSRAGERERIVFMQRVRQGGGS